MERWCEAGGMHRVHPATETAFLKSSTLSGVVNMGADPTLSKQPLVTSLG